jgi:hypothetical protein
MRRAKPSGKSPIANRNADAMSVAVRSGAAWKGGNRRKSDGAISTMG